MNQGITIINGDIVLQALQSIDLRGNDLDWLDTSMLVLFTNALSQCAMLVQIKGLSINTTLSKTHGASIFRLYFFLAIYG